MHPRHLRAAGGFAGALSLSLVFALSSGCAPRATAPVVASSASQLGYARAYPAELARVRLETETQLQLSQSVAEELNKFPDAVKAAPPAQVQGFYRSADEEGRAQAYAQSFEEATLVNRFFSEEKKALTNRVAGAAQRAAEKKSCDIQLYGSTSYSLEQGVTKQLEERARNRSEVHAQIDAAEKELGKANAETLHGQVDKISMASYVVNIRATRARQDLENLYQQSRDVRDALTAEREKLVAEPSADKEAIAQIDAALIQLEESVTKAEQTLKGLEEQERTAHEAYAKALDDLLAVMQRRADDAPDTNAKK